MQSIVMELPIPETGQTIELEIDDAPRSISEAIRLSADLVEALKSLPPLAGTAEEVFEEMRQHLEDLLLRVCAASKVRRLISRRIEGSLENLSGKIDKYTSLIEKN